jgi:hypothetical protein
LFKHGETKEYKYMGTYKFTQFGTLSVTVLGAGLIFCIIMMIIIGPEDLTVIGITGLVALILLICLLIFYNLTIYIDDSYVRFKMGIGLIAKQYPVADIKSCKAVRNNPFSGVGIRKISGGWLYNVSGLSAVELTFKSHKSIVRIGTDQPDEVAGAISRLIKEDRQESSSETRGKTSYALTLIITLTICCLTGFIVLSGLRETKVTVTSSGITIGGMYGLTVNCSDILQIDTVSAMPQIRLRTNGYAFAKNLKGNFRLQDQENARLFIKAGTPPYIFIRTKDHNIYLNKKDSQKTRDLYMLITAGCGQV